MTEGQFNVIEKGMILGYVGQTGSSARYPHLHTEVRIGVHCSLEFQLQNPSSSSCSPAVYGFDPHINPLLFYCPENVLSSNISITLATEPDAMKDGRSVLTMFYEFTFLNRIKYEVFDVSGNLRYNHTLD